EDIRRATEILEPVYRKTGHVDGYVSLEVSPALANDTNGTIAEARRLWGEVGRPNLMIKVPGTPSGVPAIRQLISEGINVNVTLLFGRKTYEAVADAHLSGLEARADKADIRTVAGVASFFVSRIDTAIDKKIDERLKSAEGEKAALLRALRGKVAIANAKLAYVIYQQIIGSARWRKLATKGALPQRLLWASTSTKDPAYRDVLYVEELVGRDTIDTMPVATLEAFREHGRVRDSLTEDLPGARHVLEQAEELGLDLDGVTDQLVVDGVRLFAESFDKLLAKVREKRAALVHH
ncbi:MAG TPA: transaldolase, partial [Alphaproteobacteria bacterium]|nr:transaldolase [Alphaproteobacteria bacterium]